MVGIYIYEGEYGKGEEGRILVEKAARDYLGDYGDGEDDVNRYEIEVDQYGKPFFTHIPLDFSISHCGAMWVCAISPMPCGIDIQEIRKSARWQAISERFYKPGEQSFVEARGEKAFYQIWVRKEALGKLIGRGFHGIMPSLTDKEGRLLNEIELEEGSALIKEIEISDYIFCAIATCDREGEEIRLLI